MFKKLFSVFCLGFFAVLFLITPVLAADQTPEKNPLCWTKDACQAAFTKNKWTWSEKNFFLKGPNDVCGSKYGVCIPLGQTDAEISIGGKTQFKNLGDYVKTIYVWAIGIGGAISLALVIFGGFMYMTSAGSSDRVKSAKQRISNALLGLILLLGSYTLLYTINPDLVRLQLPKTYMLRSISIGTNFCKDLANTNFVAPTSGRKSSVDVPADGYKIPTNPVFKNFDEFKTKIANASVPLCGFKFFWPDSNDQTCWGDICPPSKNGQPQTCVDSITNGNSSYKCVTGILSGTITASNIDYPFIDNDLKLAEFCVDNKNLASYYDSINVEEQVKDQSQKYIFMAESYNPGSLNCSNKMFYLVGEINDPLGLDDWQPIGVEGGKCSVNLWKKAGLEPQWWRNIDSHKKLMDKFDSIKANLIKQEDLQKGMVCDIELRLEEFPAL